MKQDRFLTGILIFIGALVVVSIGLYFFRQAGAQAYGPEDNPQGVVRNYVIALTRKDTNRAYGYLAAETNKPTLAHFQQGVTSMSNEMSSTSVQIQGYDSPSDQEAIVYMGINRNSGGLFQNAYVSNDTATLVRQDGAWKIRSMPYPYFSYDWYQPAAPDKSTIPAQPAS